LHLELVEGTAGALAGLRSVHGVAGVTPDRPIAFMSKQDSALGSTNGPSSKSNPDNGWDGNANGVYASDGLGGRAGARDAGAGVDVAVLDTGVSDTSALNRASGRLIDDVDTSPLMTGGDPINVGPFNDGYGHGTFMANVIAGGPVNGDGKAIGVAPGARIHVVKVADNSGTTSLISVLAGLDWVASHANTIKVANIALGSERPMPLYGPDPLNVAVEWVRAAGVSMIVAAGNNADQVTDPGFAPGAITVGAADVTLHTPAVAPFSGSAVVAGVQKPDVVANGVHVLGLLPETSVLASANPSARTKNGLWRGSGTSQASAVVSGVAAIFLASNPGASTTDVKASLRAAATSMGDDTRSGAGLERTPRRVDYSAGTGEEDFDASTYLAGAFAGPNFTLSDWLADLADAWFGDRQAAVDWATWKWQSASSVGDWSSWKWGSWKWSSWKWSSWKWSSWKWSSWKWGSWKWGSWKWGSWKWQAADWVTSPLSDVRNGAEAAR
jgi:serine protease AprX